MMEFFAVGVGGFIGSCLRFALTKLTALRPIAFPMATLLANVIAGFFAGFLLGFEQQSVSLPPRVKLFLSTGILGGLSTFSTFSVETVRLFGEGHFGMALLNVALNLGLSLLGVAAGMLCARLVFRRA